MTNGTASTTTTALETTDSVRSFFDQPENYLDRKRYDIRLRAETTRTFLEGRACETIVDIGCGDGSVSVPLLAPGRKLTMIDLSSEMLSRARARVPSEFAGNVKFYQDDLLNVPLRDASFDVVICLGVLAHVSKPEEVIRKAANLLKPGGTLVLECTDSFHFVRRLLSLPYRILSLGRKNSKKGFNISDCSSTQVVRMAKAAGLELKSTYRYSWALPGMQRIFSQNALYHLVRGFFGSAERNRNGWLGFEFIFCLRRPS